MKLTKEQIQFIDETLRENGVVYQDVKLELMDHIATNIEEYIETNDYDFTAAFKIVFEKWNPELKLIKRTVFLLNDFNGPKIVVDKIVSSFKQEVRNRLMAILVLGSLLSVTVLFMNLQEGVLKIMNNLIRAFFIFYISVTVFGLLFIWISRIKTTYSRLFLRNSGQIVGVPLILGSGMLRFTYWIQPFSFLQALVLVFAIAFVLSACFFSIKSLFEHFKTVKKYKLI